MPKAKNPDFIDWRNSQAKVIVLKDLETGVVPLEEDKASAEEVWNTYYVNQPEFITVGFEQFKLRFKDHRKQIQKKQGHQRQQMDILKRDRQLKPANLRDERGRKVFYLTEAAEKLRQDVANEVHRTMTMTELFLSRDIYHEDEWDEQYFAARVRQEVATQKFKYYLEWKRAKKARKKGLAPDGYQLEESSDDEEEDSSVGSY